MPNSKVKLAIGDGKKPDTFVEGCSGVSFPRAHFVPSRVFAEFSNRGQVCSISFWGASVSQRTSLHLFAFQVIPDCQLASGGGI